MKKIIIAILAIIPAALFGEDYGMSSFPVLMMSEYGTRSMAMADTGVAFTGSADSVFANPAGIAGLTRMSFFVSEIGWIYGTSYYSASFAAPLARSGNRAGWLSVNGALFNAGDFSTIVDGETLGSVGSGDFKAGVDYANNIFNPFDANLADKVHLNVGAGVSYAQAKLGDYNAIDLAFDAGANYSVRVPNLSDALGAEHTADDTLTVAFSFRNLAVNLKPFVDGSSVLAPWYFDAGFLYTVISDPRHRFDLTTALEKPSDNGIEVMSGLQYSYKNTIFLRGGYQYVGSDVKDLTFGVGLNFELTEKLAFRADYTMVMLGVHGTSSVFALTVTF